MNEPFIFEGMALSGEADGVILYYTHTVPITFLKMSSEKFWQLKNRIEHELASVYLILKPNDTLYIGETGSLGERGFNGSHHQLETGDRLAMFAATENIFHTSTIKYLQYQLVQIAKERGVTLTNTQDPSLTKIPEMERIKCGNYLKYMLKALPIFGVECFEKSKSVSSKQGEINFDPLDTGTKEDLSTTAHLSSCAVSRDEVIAKLVPSNTNFFIKYKKCSAHLVPDGNGVFVVKAGSELVDPPSPSLTSSNVAVSNLRNSIIEAGKVRSEPNKLVLLSDIAVGSPTAGSTLVAGTNYSGRNWLSDGEASIVDFLRTFNTNELDHKETEDE